MNIGKGWARSLQKNQQINADIVVPVPDQE